MAGEVGHVVYAARVLTHLKNRVQYSEYWLGTLFPDIRHLGVVSRHRTHPVAVTLQTLVGTSDFQTGLRVHAWIDSTREQWLREAHIKENLLWHPFVPHALKLVEDELLYPHFDDWNLIQRVLAQIHPEERVYVASASHLTQWHTLLQEYFHSAPTDESRFALSRAIGLSENSAHEVNMVVKKLQSDARTATVLNGFLHHLETVLS